MPHYYITYAIVIIWGRGGNFFASDALLTNHHNSSFKLQKLDRVEPDPIVELKVSR
jgi:hypothetical protein